MRIYLLSLIILFLSACIGDDCPGGNGFITDIEYTGAISELFIHEENPLLNNYLDSDTARDIHKFFDQSLGLYYSRKNERKIVNASISLPGISKAYACSDPPIYFNVINDIRSIEIKLIEGSKDSTFDSKIIPNNQSFLIYSSQQFDSLEGLINTLKSSYNLRNQPGEFVIRDFRIILPTSIIDSSGDYGLQTNLILETNDTLIGNTSFFYFKK